LSALFTRVTAAFKRFPGVGAKLAERMTFHLVGMSEQEIESLVNSILDFSLKVKPCRICGVISEFNPCRICSSPKRDGSILCVVENNRDAFIIERSGAFKGHYHVLGGVICPVKNISEENLRIKELCARITPQVQELLFALEQNMESEVTIKTILRALPENNLTVSRLASGIPAATGLEFIDEDTMRKAVANRSRVSR